MTRIAVIGAGPVGCAFALAAVHALPGAQIVLIERSPAPVSDHDVLSMEALRVSAASLDQRTATAVDHRAAVSFDKRVYALSPQSIALLHKLGVWQTIAPDRLTPIDEMHVSSDADTSSEMSGDTPDRKSTR